MWKRFSEDEENIRGHWGADGDTKFTQLPKKIKKLCESLNLLFNPNFPKLQPPKVRTLLIKRFNFVKEVLSSPNKAEKECQTDFPTESVSLISCV